MPDRFSASKAAMHMACHASANLELAIPNFVLPTSDTVASAEGTRRHEILAQVNELSAKEMQGFADVISYIASIRSTRRFKVLIETKVQAAWLATKPYTTADLVLYTQDELHIFDYKNGKIPVEVVDNEQLLFGAVTYAPLAPKAKGATLHIMQPNAAGNQSWFADTTTLQQFMADAQAHETAIQQGSVTFGPSDHCTFCPANPHGRGAKGKPYCPALMQIHYPQVVDEDAILALD